MAYVFVADDFTGASDTLAVLARGGMRARLFLDLPAPDEVHGLDAWGIATDARARDAEAIAALAARLGAGLGVGHGAGSFLHVKVCSTFDSSPQTGNFAVLARGLAQATGAQRIAVIGGQPSLGRYAVFGTLFARGPDGQIHRIDRHPVMACHPVTPMHEADLLRHLDRLGMPGLGRIGPGGAAEVPFPRFYDALDEGDIRRAGQALVAASAEGPVVVIGASSVAEAWLAAQPAGGVVPSRIAGAGTPDAGSTGHGRPVLGFAGSRSSLTAAQVAAAQGLARLPVAPADLAAGVPARAAAIAWARERLARRQHCLIYLTADAAGDLGPAEIAGRGAALVADVLAGGAAGGLIVAGGDTSSAVVQRLGPRHLDHAGDVCPGVPVLRAALRAGGALPLVLKGGQMGGQDFFDRAVGALHGA